MSKEKNKNILYMINPFLGVLKFDWFLKIFTSLKEETFNLFVVYNAEYEKIKDNQSKFNADLTIKKMVDLINNVVDISLITVYEDNKIFIQSNVNILEELHNELDDTDDDELVPLMVGTVVTKEKPRLYYIHKLIVGLEVLLQQQEEDLHVNRKIV